MDFFGILKIHFGSEISIFVQDFHLGVSGILCKCRFRSSVFPLPKAEEVVRSSRACWNCEKAGAFGAEAFSSRQLVEIIKNKSPKAPLVDFHSCGSFNRLSFFFGPFFFLCSPTLRARRELRTHHRADAILPQQRELIPPRGLKNDIRLKD
jgi:hypothetical protein